MFKEMRRMDKQLTEEENIGILQKGEYGILSTISTNGYPYSVPLNYVYHNGSIYFHSAPEGHKLENIAINDRISFCVATDVELLPQKFDSKYKSVILFGRASLVVDAKEHEAALVALVKKYSPQYLEAGREYIARAQGQARIVKITIEHLTGKAEK
ncbi:pyridoxamine 5'-phosphate oxidase family protein [Desulforamulus ruminis]|uniref:Pyridoxamine 5'-phosphate oxidase-related FMN-binding protein n=1 Tax=Desulforamulus ruminis (strain ATCC 23193 / DSM 2154 / NCIMB 8452 / DL) TaxID=696281 RepID=F6DR37_DESRL|nr:pyridoxamine 5'-phosphate oxidase family protein [Desulforamulus ruminis]AEG59756.1 pyridoxamine 5'-phosphate oxidase-related FMN-binding protein [Desulforamulus ruminis DSM 2154]